MLINKLVDKKKLWCMYKIEYHMAIKMNKLLLHATTWMSLKIIMLTERNKTKKIV